MQVFLTINKVHHRVSSVRVESAVGESLRARVVFFSMDTLDPEEVVGAAARIEAHAEGENAGAHHGIVASLTARATSDPSAERRYVAEIRSAIEWLEHRKVSRIFRKTTADAIIKTVLEGGSIRGAGFVSEVSSPPPERAYVTQWGETDAAFLRRICEWEGLFFRFDPKDQIDAFVLCDRSQDAPPALDAPLKFVDPSAMRAEEIVAFRPRIRRKRRPGKVTLRDHDPQRPALALEGVSEAGTDAEKEVEVYDAPGRFAVEGDGATAARIALESLRADAEVLHFESRALALRPGTSFEVDAHIEGGPALAKAYFITHTIFSWDDQQSLGTLSVEAIPLTVPYRLPRITPRAKIAGISSATVTGAPGEEIHTDAAGCVTIEFPWDREGPTDDKSSLPVRVRQDNLPGSMLIPRVGWEVLVGFEDGDPDRPYVLGRSYNGRQRPPFGLPANKTITALGSVSSPGGARPNMVSIDDAAGRQHMEWNAGYGKTTTVGANMLNQTVGFERSHVISDQIWDVGGNQTISLQNAWTVGLGSQSATVSGNQTITVQATASTRVASETVIVGAALIEKVGNPASGFAEFAKAAVLSGVGEIPVIGTALSKGYTWGNALYQGYQKGGWNGMAQAGAQTAVSEIAGQFGGADALVSAADAAGLTPWSEKAQEEAAAQQAGGGTGGASAAGAGAAAAAPGHRKFVVDGAVSEVIGALHAIESPGSIKWTTLGASTFAIAGSHATAAVRISRLTVIKSTDTAAAMSVKARKNIARNVKTAHTLKAGGALKLDAGGDVVVNAKASISIQSSGPANFKGGTVIFEVGGSKLSIDSGAVTLESAQITVNGKTQLSGKLSTG